MKISIVADQTEIAQTALKRLQAYIPPIPEEEANCLIVLGGDGFMLETMHRHISRDISFYGMNCGSIGFLLNRFNPQNVLQRIEEAQSIILHPLTMETTNHGGQRTVAHAINEVSVSRETRQAARIRIYIDGIVRLEELICDGILAATPAGSTAYNLSAHGPILPMGAPLIALTPISAFRPRRWRGALLPDTARITFEILEPQKRPVLAAADFTEVRDVTRVDIHRNDKIQIKLLFDADARLEERILNEQFLC